MSYASTINGLLSFRMGELVVRYGGEYLEKGDRRRRGAGQGVGVGRVGCVVRRVPGRRTDGRIGGAICRKDTGASWMFVLYGVGLLCNFNSETATGVLQITNKIKTRGSLNLMQAHSQR